MAIGLGTAVGYLDLDITGFARGIDSATSQLTGLGNKCTTVSGSITAIGQTMTNAGSLMTAAFTAPVVAAGAAAIKTGKDFDAGMSQVKAVSKATGQDFNTIRDRAMEMGEKTRYSASEVSDAMYYMGLAGWNAQQIYDGIPGVLALGAASGEDLARVSDIVTDSLTAFGKGAEDTSEFVNVLAEATRSSNTDVDQMGEAFKYVAPVAGAFGYSLQDVAVVLGTFANAGVKGSQAGTGLRQALNALINPSDKAAVLMDRYGVSLFNADGTTKDLMTVMQELRGTFGDVGVNAEDVSKLIEDLGVDLDTAEGEAAAAEAVMKEFGHELPTTQMEKLSAVVKIFGVRALPGMLSVINASDESFNALTESIYGAQDAYDGLGTAFGMQEEMMDNLQGDWYRFTSALGTTQIIISDLLKNGLRELLQSLTQLVNKFNSLDEEQQKNILKWATIVAAIGPVLMIIGKLMTTAVTLVQTFSKLKSAFSVLGTAISGVGSNIGAFMSLVGENGLMATITGLTGVTGGAIAAFAAVAAAVVVLIAAFADLWKNSEEFREKMIGIWEGFKDKIAGSFQKIVDAVNSLGFEFDSVIEIIKAAWKGLCDLLAPLFVGVWTFITDTIATAAELIAGAFQVICGIIKGIKDGDWTLLWEGLKTIVTAAIEGIVGWIDNIGETVWNMIQVVANWFGADWHTTWDEAKQAVADWFHGVVNWFSQLPGKIASFFSQIWDNVTTWAGNMVSKAIEVGSNFVKGIVDWFVQLPGKVGGFLSSVWQSITTWAGNMVDKAREMGTNFINNVVSFFQQLPYQVGYFIGYTLTSVAVWVSNMIQKAYEMGRDFLNNVVTWFTQLPGKIQQFISSAWQNVVTWATNMINKAREMAQQFLDNIVSFFQQLPGKIKGFIDSAWNNVTTWATNMVNKAREMAQQFLDNIVSFFTQLPGKIKGFIDSAWNNVTAWATNMVNKAREVGQQFLENINSFFTQLPGKVKGFLDSVVTNVTSWATTMGQKAKDAASTFLNNVTSGLTNLASNVKSKLDEALAKVTSWGSDLAAKGKQAINDMITGIKNAASNIASQVQSIGSDIVNGVWKGIQNAKDHFFSQVKSFFSGLVDGAKDALGIKSPSRVMANEVGKWLPPGVAYGFEKALPGAIKTMEKALNNEVDDMSIDNIDASTVRFSYGMMNTMDALVDWFADVEERMGNIIDGMTNKLTNLVYMGNQLVGPDGVIIDTGYAPTNRGKFTQVFNPQSDNGDTVNRTYVFYTDKPIDEIEAAKQVRRVERDIAEGF